MTAERICYEDGCEEDISKRHPNARYCKRHSEERRRRGLVKLLRAVGDWEESVIKSVEAMKKEEKPLETSKTPDTLETSKEEVGTTIKTIKPKRPKKKQKPKDEKPKEKKPKAGKKGDDNYWI